MPRMKELATTLAVLLVVSVGTASATLSAVGDAGSWVTGGGNTLAGLGFSMTRMTDNTNYSYNGGGPEFYASGLDADLGRVSFSQDLMILKGGAGWGWGGWDRAVPVYSTYPNRSSITVTMPVGVRAFDLYVGAYPADTDATVTVLVSSQAETIAMVQEVGYAAWYGDSNEKYFGFYDFDHEHHVNINSSEQ